jgi:hypothetical protein
MPKDNVEIEIRITKAMASLSAQSKPNIAKTAREFAVPMRIGFDTDGMAGNPYFSDNLTVGSSVLHKKPVYAILLIILIVLAPR